MRLGAVFVAICMVLIAASAGATVYLGFGFSATEAVIVALAVLTAWASTTPCRPGSASAPWSAASSAISRAAMPTWRARWPRSAAGSSALEGRMDTVQHRARAATDPLAVEIGELGTLVKQLAETVAAYETRFARNRQASGRAGPAPDRRHRRPWRQRRAARAGTDAGRAAASLWRPPACADAGRRPRRPAAPAPQPSP